MYLFSGFLHQQSLLREPDLMPGCTKAGEFEKNFARTVTSAIGLFASTELTLQRTILPHVYSVSFLMHIILGVVKK